ncbi:MAG: RHS repeat domain-containing protein [Thermodesulfovibrionales bacterium]
MPRGYADLKTSGKHNIGISILPPKMGLIYLLLSLFLIASVAIADDINYSYDDAGHLIRIEKGAERILYQYDEAGNLISVTKEIGTSQSLPPVLQGIEPDIFLIGNTYNIAITGQNLLTTSDITSGNPYLTIRNIIATDTKIFATISITNGASPGAANITVTTSYGSASMSINIYKLIIEPKTISLMTGQTTSLSASLTPSAPADLGVAIINNNPDIINAPFSLVIPAGRSAYFTVKALKVGTGKINIATEVATVFVITGDYSISAAPLCVGFGYMQAEITSANPVSVGWSPAGIVVSAPVCVKIGN